MTRKKIYKLVEWGTDGTIFDTKEFDTRAEANKVIAKIFANDANADVNLFKIEVEEIEVKNELEKCVEALIDELNHFGYKWDVRYNDDATSATITFKEYEFPLWTSAVLSSIADFMNTKSREDFGWCINHKAELWVTKRIIKDNK